MNKRHNYSLLGEESPDYGVWLRIDFRKYVIIICSFPLASFLFCILWSILYNFESSTVTQCNERQPYNVLPSVSAAIGGFSPQREVWKFCITIAFIPRILITYHYLEHNLDKFISQANILVILATTLNFLENVALLSLTYFDSTFYYPMHEKSFITFVITSELYMMLMVFLQCRCKRKPLNVTEGKGLKLKTSMLFANIVGILFAMYYFIEHNFSCLDYSYTKFALSEYMVVLSNIIYHSTVIYDLPDCDYVIRTRGPDLIKR